MVFLSLDVERVFDMEVGIQVSSVAKYLTDEAGVFDAFNKFKQIGYRYGQIQWISPDVTPDSIRRALLETRINCVGTQDYYDEVMPKLDENLKSNAMWGGKYICVSGIPERFKSPEGCKKLADEMNEKRKIIEDAGMVLTFHPVYSDYAAFGGTTLLEILLEHAADTVQVCLDVFHVHKAGYDPVEWIFKLAGRVDLIHFKDYFTGNDGKEVLSSVGQGVLDWDGIIQACLATSVKFCFAEQETSVKDPFECLKESYEYITGKLAKMER